MSDLNDDNQFEEYTPEEEPLTEAATSEGAAPLTGNRNFMIALIAIVALIVVGFGIILFLVLRKPATANVLADQQRMFASNTAIAQSGTQQALAAIQARTPSPTVPPTAAPATNTPVIAVPTATAAQAAGQAETPDPTLLATLATGAPTATLSAGAIRTATLGALLTQVAANQAGTAQVGGGAPTSTALPATGFADEVGLPGLLGLALGLIVLIFLARTLRLTTK